MNWNMKEKKVDIHVKHVVNNAMHFLLAAMPCISFGVVSPLPTSQTGLKEREQMTMKLGYGSNVHNTNEMKSFNVTTTMVQLYNDCHTGFRLCQLGMFALTNTGQHIFLCQLW